MDTHTSGYGAAAKTAPSGNVARAPKTPSTRFVGAILLSFALLGLVVVQHPLQFGDQVIDVSVKTGDADSEAVSLSQSTKIAVKASALATLMHHLDKSSHCWLRDLGLSTSCHTTNDKADTPKAAQPRLRATGKSAVADTHGCLALLMEEKKQASGTDTLDGCLSANGRQTSGTAEGKRNTLISILSDAKQCTISECKGMDNQQMLQICAITKPSGDVAGGDVPGCDKSTCSQCMKNPPSAAFAGYRQILADQLELKDYIDSSAAAAVYKEKNADIVPYLASPCPLAIPAELPCLERLLDKRVSETKTAAQGVNVEGETEADIIAKCGSVETYVNIVAAHQAETDLQKFIKDITAVTEYEGKNPSITDYTDGTCPIAKEPIFGDVTTSLTCPSGVYVTKPGIGGSDTWCNENCNKVPPVCPAVECACGGTGGSGGASGGDDTKQVCQWVGGPSDADDGLAAMLASVPRNNAGCTDKCYGPKYGPPINGRAFLHSTINCAGASCNCDPEYVHPPLKEYVSWSWIRGRSAHNPPLDYYCNVNCNRDPPYCPGTISPDEARMAKFPDSSGTSSGLDGSTQKPGGSYLIKEGSEEMEMYEKAMTKYNCKPKGYVLPSRDPKNTADYVDGKPRYGACGAAAPPACTVP